MELLCVVHARCVCSFSYNYIVITIAITIMIVDDNRRKKGENVAQQRVNKMTNVNGYEIGSEDGFVCAFRQTILYVHLGNRHTY